MQEIDVALLVLRAVFGLFLSWHGVNKVRSGLDGTARWFGSIGMTHPRLQARLAAAVETAGGVAFAAGIATPLASAAVTAVMLVAIVTVHMKVGFFIFLPEGGWEYCASIAAVSVAVGIAGPGQMSVDHLLGVTNGGAGIALAVAGGPLLAAAHLALAWRPDRDPPGGGDAG
jgi:putative oxidoreductase